LSTSSTDGWFVVSSGFSSALAMPLESKIGVTLSPAG
jgi:hypothetical protein